VTCGNCWSVAVVVLVATGRANRSAIGTLVDRTSLYLRLIHLPDGRRAHHLQVGRVGAMADLPAEARRTLT
jgi:transposase, IS30 family